MLGEILQHQFFFLTKLDKESERHPYEHQQAAPRWGEPEHRTENRQEDACVNGMPHQAIRPGRHKFMIFLEGDHSAPIAAEMDAAQTEKANPIKQRTQPTLSVRRSGGNRHCQTFVACRAKITPKMATST